MDNILAEKGFVFKRYVDDYSFYFRTASEARDNISAIDRILNEYNLTLNTEKTQIQEFPFNTISNIREVMNKAYLEDGVFGALNAASQLYSAGEKGAYKYAIKFIRNKKLDNKEENQLIIPTLINIMLLNPKYGLFITEYLKANLGELRRDTVTRVFNDELQRNIDNNLQQEALLFIQLIRDLDIEISGQNILKTIKSDNDLAIIIALDLWKNRNNRVKRSKIEAEMINKEVEKLLKSLEGEKLSGPRWMLLYEIVANKLVKKAQIPVLNTDPFFEKMLEKNICFYKSVKRT